MPITKCFNISFFSSAVGCRQPPRAGPCWPSLQPEADVLDLIRADLVLQIQGRISEAADLDRLPLTRRVPSLGQPPEQRGLCPGL